MSSQAAGAPRDPLVFVSSFAAGDQGGINAYRLDLASGKLTPTHRTGGVANAFFLALTRDRKYLYAIDAPTFGGTANERVAAFQVVGRNGELKELNRVSSKGTASCYLMADRTGKTLLLANYSTGSVCAYPIRADGSLGEAATFVQHVGKSNVNPGRQEGPHAHSFVISPNNRHAYAADLGLDQIVCYDLDAATATITPSHQPFVRTAPGHGPRHLWFHPNGKHLYAIDELSETVTLYDYSASSGQLIERQIISTLPPDFKGESYTADLKITPDGRFLYGTNRGHDSIACYRIAEDGRLSLIGIEPSLGKGPQNLLITPDGKLLLCANMPGNNVAVFRIDQASGKLTSVGAPTAVTGASCIMLIP